jgi:hypothetical protein
MDTDYEEQGGMTRIEAIEVLIEAALALRSELDGDEREWAREIMRAVETIRETE